MILDLPYIYPLQATLRGKRNPQVIWIIDDIPVEVRELTMADVDVVTGVTRTVSDRFIRKDMVVVDRRVVRPLMSLSSTPEGVECPRGELTVETLPRAVAAMTGENATWSSLPVRTTPPVAKWDDRLRRLETIAVRSVEHSGKDEARARAAAAYRGMAIIDGRIFAPGAEPVWEIISGYSDGKVVPIVRLAPSSEGLGQHVVFRADRNADAVKFATWLGAQTGVEPTNDDSIEGIDRVDWKFDDLDHTVRENVKRLHKAANQDGLHVMDDSFFAPWLRLRALQRKDHVGRADASDYAEIARQMSEAVRLVSGGSRHSMVLALREILGPSLWRMENLESAENVAEDDAALSLAVAP